MDNPSPAAAAADPPDPRDGADAFGYLVWVAEKIALLHPPLPPRCEGCGHSFYTGLRRRTKCRACAPEQYL
jgi:hypothetical protein